MEKSWKMGSKSTFTYCQYVIGEYEEQEAEDFEGTTRDERYWMDAAYSLAKALADTTGYKTFPLARNPSNQLKEES
jgi:hypothetical protein